MLRTERKRNSCWRFKFFSFTFYDIVLVFVVAAFVVVVISAFLLRKGGLGRFHGW